MRSVVAGHAQHSAPFDSSGTRASRTPAICTRLVNSASKEHPFGGEDRGFASHHSPTPGGVLLISGWHWELRAVECVVETSGGQARVLSLIL
eukprot:gene24024-biopygen1317